MVEDAARDGVVWLEPAFYSPRYSATFGDARTATEIYWLNYQLYELEARLSPELFFRARREVLVNVDRIKEIRPYFKGGYLLIMADDSATEIAISERQVRSFRQRTPGL